MSDFRHAGQLLYSRCLCPGRPRSSPPTRFSLSLPQHACREPGAARPVRAEARGCRASETVCLYLRRPVVAPGGAHRSGERVRDAGGDVRMNFPVHHNGRHRLPPGQQGHAASASSQPGVRHPVLRPPWVTVAPLTSPQGPALLADDGKDAHSWGPAQN